MGQPSADNDVFDRTKFEKRMKAKLAGISLQKALVEAIKKPDNAYIHAHEILICVGTFNNFDVVRP